MTKHLHPIYEAWGGNAEAMAADIEELGVTVRQWRNRGDIPSRAWPKIIKAASEKRGVVFKLEDFLPPEVKGDLSVHGEDVTGAEHSTSAIKSPAIIGAAESLADNLARNIGEDGQAVDLQEEADSPGPFSEASRPTCSPIAAPPNMPAASQICSTATIAGAPPGTPPSSSRSKAA